MRNSRLWCALWHGRWRVPTPEGDDPDADPETVLWFCHRCVVHFERRAKVRHAPTPEVVRRARGAWQHGIQIE